METLAVEVMAVRFSGDDFAVLAALTDDGDEVTLSATAPGPDGTRIGFGEVTGRIAPARG